MIKRLLQHSTKNSFILYSLAFVLMVIPPVGLYFTAQAQTEGLTLGLLALVVIGNILVLFPG